MYRRVNVHRRIGTRVLLLLIAISPLLLILILPGCKSKVAGNPDDTIMPWRLELRAPAVMYRSAVGGQVPGDTIVVRVYNPEGAVQAGITVYVWALRSPNAVPSDVMTVADTITQSWGTNVPLRYSGAGDPDTSLQELITARAVLHGDTLAAAEARFFVRDPASLVLASADTMYRDSTGHVPHDTIRVRAFNSDGALLANIRVHCRCLFSPDSVDSLAVTFADTLLKPWGTINPITYWGGGNPEGMESVNCWAVINGDTVEAQRSFFVWYRN